MINWIQLSNVQTLTPQGIIALAETAHWIKVGCPLVKRHPTLISNKRQTATGEELYNSTLRQQVARYRRDRERWPRRGKTVRLENPGFPCNNSDPYRSLYQCHQHLKQQKWALRCTTTISGKTDRQTFRYFPSWTSWGCLPPGSTCDHLWYHMRHAALSFSWNYKSGELNIIIFWMTRLSHLSCNWAKEVSSTPMCRGQENQPGQHFHLFINMDQDPF